VADACVGYDVVIIQKRLTRGCWPSPAHSFSDPSPAGLMTIFYCLRLENSPTWRKYSPSLYSSGTYRTENISSIIAYYLVAGETACSQSCCLATAVVLSPVYRVVAWQWVYMSQYITAVLPIRSVHFGYPVDMYVVNWSMWSYSMPVF
jgi:hypothetical protein